MSAAAVAAVRSAHRRAAPWPYGGLDVGRLRAGGWRPTPVHEVILKVHQRCNLACDYCYMYTQADQSWRDRPAVMPADVWQATIDNLGRHISRHRLTGIRFILHGGEPLLLGAERLGRLAADLRGLATGGCAVEIGLQTNGVLLDAARMGELRRHNVMVGVSVDGGPADHDRHRVSRAGGGTFTAVRKALDLLRQPENRPSYAGILCTVAPEVDPVATYEQLLAFDPPLIDFLLPHANWQHPPRRPAGSPAPYGDWLVAVFDRWYDTPNPTRIRLFDDAISLVLGGAGRSEQLGLSPAALIVVESDGAIEQVDALKSAYPGACATGLDIRRDELDVALEDPGIVARQIGREALSVDCLDCRIHHICGAGHYVHRYHPDTGFRNRSVYCEDLQRFIDHVLRRVASDLGQLSGAAAK